MYICGVNPTLSLWQCHRLMDKLTVSSLITNARGLNEVAGVSCLGLSLWQTEVLIGIEHDFLLAAHVLRHGHEAVAIETGEVDVDESLIESPYPVLRTESMGCLATTYDLGAGRIRWKRPCAYRY